MYSRGKVFIFSNGNFREFFGWWRDFPVSEREFPVAVACIFYYLQFRLGLCPKPLGLYPKPR